MLLLVVLAVLLSTGDVVAAESPCAVLSSPPPMTGKFDEFDLNDRCASSDALQFTLTTNATDDAPLFTTMVGAGTTCGWSVATISAGRVVTVARVQENVWASPPVTPDNKSYWFLLEGRYYEVDAHGESNAPALTPGYSVTSIGATQSGRLFAIESEKRNAFDGRLQVVDVRTGKSRALPATGFTDQLTRAWDGNLYFRLMSHWRCYLYEVGADLHVILKATCPWENTRGIALSTHGSVWQPFIFGVGDYAPRGPTLPGIGVFSKYNCIITNTAALEARNVTSDAQGNVWFTYANRLWRRDVLGHLFSLTLPPHVSGAMVETRDGDIWITGDNPSGRPALYRFRPSAP